MHKIAAVIVNYRSDKELKPLLKSLTREQKSSKKTKLKIIVIDNGTGKNRGFAAGANIGIRQALEENFEAVMLLNPDTVITDGFIDKLLISNADVIAPVIRFKRQGKWIFDCGGKVGWWGRTRHLERNPSTTLRTGNETIDYVSGCCMLIKKRVLEKIGMLDERFFLYFEDVDFCLRAKKAGFRVAVEPKALIIHNIKEGADKPLSQKLMHLKSNFLFINKWIPWYKRPVGYLYCLMLLIKISL